MSSDCRGRIAAWFAGAVAATFGVLTIAAGSKPLIAGEAVGPAASYADHALLLVSPGVGSAYLVAGVGLLLLRRWAVWLSAFMAGATVWVFVTYGAQFFAGGSYEMHTIGAMALHSLLWVMIALVAWRALRGDAAPAKAARPPRP